METTEEAVPTITSPITHSSATSTRRTVEMGISRPPMRTPVAGPRAWRCVDDRDVDDRDVDDRDAAVALALRSGVMLPARPGRGRASPLGPTPGPRRQSPAPGDQSGG